MPRTPDNNTTGSPVCCFWLRTGKWHFGDKCSFAHQDIHGRACSKGKACRRGHQRRSLQKTNSPEVVSFVKDILCETHKSADGIEGGVLGATIAKAFPTFDYGVRGLTSFMEGIPDVQRTCLGSATYYKLRTASATHEPQKGHDDDVTNAETGIPGPTTKVCQTFVCCHWLRGCCEHNVSHTFSNKGKKKTFLHEDRIGVPCGSGDKCEVHRGRTAGTEGLPQRTSAESPSQLSTNYINLAETIREPPSPADSEPHNSMAKGTSQNSEANLQRDVRTCAPQAHKNIADPWGKSDPWSTTSAGQLAKVESSRDVQAWLCARCSQRSAVGTWDVLSRNTWHCKSCSLDVLDDYNDKDLARHVRFLREHALNHPDQPHTHSSFLGYNDPTCFCGKYNLPCDEETIRKYCDAVAFFFDKQTPLLHMEVFGKDHRVYCEDLDVLCPKGKPAEEHILSEDFLSFRMCLVAESFPTLESVTVHVYTSSGFSRKYGHWKVSVHIVWPGILVTETQAAMLRQHCVETLDALSNADSDDGNLPARVEVFRPTISNMAREFRDQHSDNTWNKVIDASVVLGGNGLRVPLSDKKDRPKAGDKPRRKDNRPKVPVGTWQFDRSTQRASCTVMRHQLQSSEWVRLGLCRCSPGTQLTEWVEPPLQKPLETPRERMMHVGSGDCAAGLQRRAAEKEAVTSNGPETKEWTNPGPVAKDSREIIAVWHDGSRGDHGIGGSTTVTVARENAPATIFSGYLFVRGNFSPACGEYLGFLLGLRRLAEHPQVLEGRELVMVGDSVPIQRHMAGHPPSIGSEQLQPLAAFGLELFKRLNANAKVKVVERSLLVVQDKMAKFALREHTSSLEDPELVALLQEAEATWRIRSDQAVGLDQFLSIVEQSAANKEARLPTAAPASSSSSSPTPYPAPKHAASPEALAAPPAASPAAPTAAPRAAEVAVAAPVSFSNLPATHAKAQGIGQPQQEERLCEAAVSSSNQELLAFNISVDDGRAQSVIVPWWMTAENLMREFGTLGVPNRLLVVDQLGIVGAPGQEVLLVLQSRMFDVSCLFGRAGAPALLMLRSGLGMAGPLSSLD